MGRKIAVVVAGLVLCAAVSAAAFNFDSYPAADLDVLLAKPPLNPTHLKEIPIEIQPARKMRLRVRLTAYVEPCDMTVFQLALPASTSQEFAKSIQVSGCIGVESMQGKPLRLYIQDQVADYLPDEVPLGAVFDVYCLHLFTDKYGPGILVNEFQALEGEDKA